MNKIDSLLDARFAPKQKSSKMSDLAEQSSAGRLSSFSGVFGLADLSDGEKSHLQSLLEKYNVDDKDIVNDLRSLVHITSEIKAINNQAALLHGERIKQAQVLLKAYREGAFTAWLLNTYGNRQTPYNLLQYYEFYQAIPAALRQTVESMPRQAIYTLASREGSLEEKLSIVESFSGQSKAELLTLIRERFPLTEGDKRQGDWVETAKQALEGLIYLANRNSKKLKRDQRDEVLSLVKEFTDLI